MSFLQNIMKQLMDYLYGYTNNYGIAIIVLTALIKLILLPFSFHQYNSIKKMQEIAPLQKKIQEKYKNDKEKMNKELMKLYEEHKINPMGGCLPILIQFPFIIALFQVLKNYNFGNAGFLWIKDLGAPDTTYILPVLSAVTTYLSSRIGMPQGADNQQGTMSIVMSAFIGWMAAKFPSGLALYWVVSNLMQMLQQFLIMRSPASAKKEAE